MTELQSKKYKCVNCGEPAAALFKTYGPSVLKLTKCDKCKGIVDKYIEYDPVIVIIDLVLMSKEAQRHVLYNTEFKAYWKLLIILIMLETYGVWRNDSLFNIIINTLCGSQNNNTINSTLVVPLNISILESWRSENCAPWVQEENGNDTDLFIWEKDFYIKFLYTFAGIVSFVLTVQILMHLLKHFVSINKVRGGRLARAVPVSRAAGVLALGAAWAPDAAPCARALHHALVFAYSFAVFVTVLAVLYECPVPIIIIVLLISNVAKFATSFYITPYLRTFIT